MLRAVCFDLMDTLIYDPYREALHAATGLDLATLAAVRDRTCWPDFESGTIDEATFARRYFPEGSPHTFDLAAFHRERRNGYRFLPGIEPLLESLRGKVGLYVASNYPVWIEEVRVTFGLDRFFDGVVASHHVGVRKPEPSFYEALLSRVPHPPETCLFVDDRSDNCDAAERSGMRAHHFKDTEDLLVRLRHEKVIGSE